MLEGLDDIIPTFIEAVSGRVEDRYGRSVGVLTALLLAVALVGVLGVLIWWAVS